ncbi:ABC transporter permease [Tuwongella immobilis]|uniref:: ABC2_membrane_2 n=1 Tax=Tuwongella immobilis TaxID=692036 RepID=A0A6C2YS17_9BACT|nr:ABC transporter permease subunit [Tuwongella immobilis]VIP04147.1 : ABC2_membrane_2 [Tuwongella immobilis]VTS05659.1 : ABC2_membrane_2 [Tuwongella immobilis]
MMPESATIPDAPLPVSPPSPVRAWLTLVRFAFWRHLRVRQMVLIAIGLLVLVGIGLAITTITTGWTLNERRARGSALTNRNWVKVVEMSQQAVPFTPAVNAQLQMTTFVTKGVLDASAFPNFSRWVFGVFLSFLMPVLTLAFAISAIGGERESRSLIWQLTRPLPRWSIYLAQVVGVLPWCIGLVLLGFFGLCRVVGPVGELAFSLYWPAILMGTLAFASLFVLIGSFFRRPAIVALLYAFFIETLIGGLPGTLKRCSISFYTRCLLYDAAETQSFSPERSTIFNPVSDTFAWLALIAITIGVTAIGAILFARSEFRDDL